MLRSSFYGVPVSALVVSLLAFSCSGLQDIVPRERESLRLCIEQPRQPGFWYQYGVYSSRPLPAFENGFLNRFWHLIHGSGSDFGDASLAQDPDYSGLGPLHRTISLTVPASDSSYLYLLIGKEEKASHYPGGGEAELALLVSFEGGSDFSFRTVADSRRLIYEGSFSRDRYDNVLIRLRPRNQEEKGMPKDYYGWPALFSQPTFPEGSYGLSWAPGGCPSDATRVVQYD